jgi:exodeoxyribonuclease VII small subunit
MTPVDPATIRFEQAMSELEKTLRELEDGTTTLEDALAKYERGVALVRACYAQLQNAEHKIRLLAGLNEEGKPELRPFEHVASVEKAKPKRGNTKREDDTEPF